MMVNDEKKKIRREVRDCIVAMDRDVRNAADESLVKRLREFLATHESAGSQNVMAYIPLSDEPDITPCFGWFKGLCLPQMLPGGGMCARLVHDWQRDCISGEYGVMQPADNLPIVSPDDISMVIVPGRAFTREGKRLGRGKGFYDRFLVQCPKQTIKIALCYTCQIYPDLPCQYHDLPVDVVVSR